MTGGLGVLVDAAVGESTADAFIVTEIDLTVASTAYSSRITTPYQISKVSGISKEALAGIIRTSMDAAIDALVIKLQ